MVLRPVETSGLSGLQWSPYGIAGGWTRPLLRLLIMTEWQEGETIMRKGPEM